MSSSTTVPPAIDHLLAQISTGSGPNNIGQLLHTFTHVLTKDNRELLLCGFVSNGADPLSMLDMAMHTLGALYIMSARLHAKYTVVPPPTLDAIRLFCRAFSPDQARLAPERVTKLAKGIQRLATHFGDLNLAIEPLSDLVQRYPPNPSYLTTIHPIFLLTCVSTRQFLPALPVLANPITSIDTTLLTPDLHYSDNLTYHYTGGIALAALKKWKDAEEFFEICVTSPGSYPASIQMEALKKLKLVQLISTGKTSELPKYTHPLLLRLFKNTAYQAFANAYPHNTPLMKDICEKERQTFNLERNTGLLHQALARAPRWVLKKLTATYVTLHLSDIGKQVGINDEAEVRMLLLSMIESGDVSATLSAEGSVTFTDPPFGYSKSDVDNALLQVQSQTSLLAFLDGEVARSKEFLAKAVKASGASAGGADGMGMLGGAGGSWMGPGGGGSMDEELFGAMGMPRGTWDDSIYA